MTTKRRQLMWDAVANAASGAPAIPAVKSA